MCHQKPVNDRPTVAQPRVNSVTLSTPCQGSVIQFTFAALTS